jgi:hypothetical protein
MQVDDFDLALVGHVAMSSAGHNVPKILRGILTRNGVASIPELMETSVLSHPTVRHYMQLLRARRRHAHEGFARDRRADGAVRAALPGADLGKCAGVGELKESSGGNGKPFEPCCGRPSI